MKFYSGINICKQRKTGMIEFWAEKTLKAFYDVQHVLRYPSVFYILMEKGKIAVERHRNVHIEIKYIRQKQSLYISSKLESQYLVCPPFFFNTASTHFCNFLKLFFFVFCFSFYPVVMFPHCECIWDQSCQKKKKKKTCSIVWWINHSMPLSLNINPVLV